MPFELTNGFIKVFVVRRQLTFDFVLSDAIADLDGRLIRDGWASDVLQIGPGDRERLSQRFDVDSSLQVSSRMWAARSHREEHDREQHSVSAVPFLCWWLPWRPHSRPGLKIHPRRNRPRRKAADQPRRQPKVPFTISKETTRILEPLDADGYPDYIAAINQHCRKGVTPENNAAVLVWRAMGPSEIPAGQRAEYFKQLGIDPPPEKGDYFVTMGAVRPAAHRRR